MVEDGSSEEEDIKSSKVELEDDEEEEEEEEEEESTANPADPLDISAAKSLVFKGAPFELQWKNVGALYWLDSPKVEPSTKIIGFDMVF